MMRELKRKLRHFFSTYYYIVFIRFVCLIVNNIFQVK
jgi:hypothetical protein